MGDTPIPLANLAGDESPKQAQPAATNASAVTRSASISQLVAALTAAQLKFDPVVKDAENQAFSRGGKKSMYATLDSVIKATRNALASNGLAIVALPHEMVDDKRLRITSLLVHTSNEFIETTMTLTAVDRVTPHELGKLITYARRYQWTSLTGVAPEDDTDANEASGVGSKEAAEAVASHKIEELKRRKAANVLFYSYPPSHNGHFAEFLNIRDYLAAHEDQEDALRMIFTAHGAKKTKDDTVLVAAEKMQALLEKLAGEVGITIKELKA